MNRPPGWLEAAADRLMIQNLLARYAWEIDHGTPESFAALFTPDGVFEPASAKAGKVGEHFAAFLEACRTYRRR